MAARKARKKHPEPQRRDWKKHVVPDPVDFRDRLYVAPVRARPPARLDPSKRLPVLFQGDTQACTGFALASVVHLLLWNDRPRARLEQVSPYMLYDMARRYDEFPGSSDTGSSLRGALKGWSRHGVCKLQLWDALDMPPVPEQAKDDWWGDAMRRPLGAYYRLDPAAITDMHVALHEVGILYASAMTHAGWDEEPSARPKSGSYWPIPYDADAPLDGGHAFAIVGYTEQGFIVQNSWGEDWGGRGLALLDYADWRKNAMDCWVVQLGVATAVHEELAVAPALRVKGEKVQLAVDTALRNHELTPYIVDVENNGVLSQSGRFRTSPGDLEALFSVYLQRFREQWNFGEDEPVDIAIYAHGGMVSEDSAEKTAALWIPELYEKRIFPIFVMWETDALSTLANLVKDWLSGEPPRTGGIRQWWDERIERLLSPAGTKLWDEIKENGAAISGPENPKQEHAKQPAGFLLRTTAEKSPVFARERDRLHLIGHSAGSILHGYLLRDWAQHGFSFRSANMMAPAATTKLFDALYRPLLASKKLGQYNQWHLSDDLEKKDPTVRALLYYSRSLLYLVSESFEGGKQTPLLGMQKYYDAIPKTANMRAWAAVVPETRATSHGGFDDDGTTRQSVIRQIEAARG